MRGSPENIAVLRHLLAERFPSGPARFAAVLPTGVAAIDEAGGGGIPLNAITEIVSPHPSSGGQSFILSLLAATRARRERAALVDGCDAFDPGSFEPALLQHLVWARCQDLDQALHATDILAHDANLGLLLLDLRGFAGRALHAVPATTWYRFQRTLAQGDMAMIVLTTLPLVGSAVLRFTLPGRFTLDQLDDLQAELLRGLPAEVHRSRLHLERKIA